MDAAVGALWAEAKEKAYDDDDWLVDGGDAVDGDAAEADRDGEAVVEGGSCWCLGERGERPCTTSMGGRGAGDRSLGARPVTVTLVGLLCLGRDGRGMTGDWDCDGVGVGVGEGEGDGEGDGDKERDSDGEA